MDRTTDSTLAAPPISYEPHRTLPPVARLFTGARPFESYAVFGDAAFVRHAGERPSRWAGLGATPCLLGLYSVVALLFAA